MRRGCAITFITREQGEQLTSIEKRINTVLPEYTIEGYEAYRPRTPRPVHQPTPTERIVHEHDFSIA